MDPFFQAIRHRIIPRNSNRENLARFIQRKILEIYSGFSNDYKSWIRQNEPDENGLSAQQQLAAGFSYKPLIGIILIIFNPSIKYLNEAIESVRSQSYQNWELHILPTCLPALEAGQKLEAYPELDRRIQLESFETGAGLISSINHLISRSQAEFFGFLDQADCLAPFALYEVCAALIEYASTDLFYSDEDHLTLDGKRRYGPIFKPAFSIDTLRSYNYINHFLVIRKRLGDHLGWLREDFDGSEEYDLVLRAVEQAGLITHIPQVLYHQRISASSKQPNNSMHKTGAEIVALREHLMRCNLEAEVGATPVPGIFKLKYQLKRTALVSIIIPNHEHAADLLRCVESVLTCTNYEKYEILIIENNSQNAETFRAYAQLQALDKRVKVVEYKQQLFNFSEINNFAVKFSQGEVLLFLNNDTRVINPDWLERMLEYALRPDVGAVGAKLYFSNMLIQHAGVVIGMGLGAGHYYVGSPKEEAGQQFNLIIPKNISAVTGACLMMRRKIFDEIGGFDNQYRLSYGDIDLCLQIRQKDYLVVWTPFAELIHYESKTRGYEITPDKDERLNQEAQILMDKWPEIYSSGDPYYNPNLSLSRGDFSVRSGKCEHVARAMHGLFLSGIPPASAKRSIKPPENE